MAIVNGGEKCHCKNNTISLKLYDHESMIDGIIRNSFKSSVFSRLSVKLMNIKKYIHKTIIQPSAHFFIGCMKMIVHHIEL